jgi:S1-C subfamily serine protease
MTQINASWIRHSSPSRWLLSIAAAMLALATAAGAFAQSEAPTVDELLAAVVGIRTSVPEGARTAGSLGVQRTGSGVVIDGEGLIVTIGYLILEAEEVEIMVNGDRVISADILAYDHDSGFGLLRANEPLNVTPMGLGESSKLQQWDQLLVSGFGGPEAVRPAVLVARRDFAGFWEYLLENAIFTAPPYPLFGGAALVGPDGKLLGIGSLVVADALRGERQLPGNMFVPVDRLKAVLADLLTQGRSSAPPRPWLGIYTEEVEGLLLVRRTAEDGPAASAGIESGDVIVGVGTGTVSSMADFYRKVWAAGAPGDSISVTVLKGNELKDLAIIAGDRYQWLRLR